MVTTYRHHREGEVCVVLAAILGGLYPIFLAVYTKAFQPLLLLTFANIWACIVLLPWIAKNLSSLKLSSQDKRKLFLHVLLYILAFSLVFVGAQFTSAVNTSILLTAEILFTIAICPLLFGEHVSTKKFIGAMVIFVGVICVLFQGSFGLNWGDILILLSTPVYPFANLYSKSLLQKMKVPLFIFLRYSVSLLFFIPVMLLLYFDPVTILSPEFHIGAVLLGVLQLTVLRLVWFRGLRVLPISYAVPIYQINPAFSLLFAYVFVHEIPSLLQWIGFFCTLSGAYLLAKD